MLSLWRVRRVARFLVDCAVVFRTFCVLVLRRVQASSRTLPAYRRHISLLIFGIGLLPIFWRIWVYEVWLDEVFSYVFLVKRGFFVSLAYYPGPNNHVFFMVVASLLNPLAEICYIPIPMMRLLAFGGVLGTSVLLYGWLLVRKGWTVASVCVFIFLMQSPVQFYGYLARGYAWEMFFFLVLWISLWEWKRHPRTLYIGIASLSAVAGFYTLPTFLYAYLPLLLAVFYPLSQPIKRYYGLLFAQFFVFLGVMSLYAPIILLNGIGAFAGNAWLQVGKDLFWQDLLSGQYGADVVGFWGLEMPYWGFWIVCVGSLGLWWKTSKDMRVWLFLAFLLPVVLLLYQQVLPPVRVWSYLSVAIALFFANRKRTAKAFALILSIVFVINWQFFPKIPAHSLVAKQVFASKVQHIFANEDTYQMFIRYEYAKQNTPLDIQVICSNPPPMPYETVLLARKQKTPACIALQEYKQVFENEEIVFFQRKK